MSLALPIPLGISSKVLSAVTRFIIAKQLKAGDAYCEGCLQAVEQSRSMRDGPASSDPCVKTLDKLYTRAVETRELCVKATGLQEKFLLARRYRKESKSAMVAMKLLDGSRRRVVDNVAFVEMDSLSLMEAVKKLTADLPGKDGANTGSDASDAEIKAINAILERVERDYELSGDDVDETVTERVKDIVWFNVRTRPSFPDDDELQQIVEDAWAAVFIADCASISSEDDATLASSKEDIKDSSCDSPASTSSVLSAVSGKESYAEL